MGALEDSLKKGLSTIQQGRGIDPATIYGLNPGGNSAPPNMGAFTPPVTGGGAPASPSPTPGPASAQTTTAAPAPMTSTVPVGGPGPPNPTTAAGSGEQANTAPMSSDFQANGLGPNKFGLDPRVNIHHIMDYLLPKVRDLESTNDYKADRATKYPGQTASGAYQYTDSTWNGYGGYNRAVDAPPEVQDKKAREDFMSRLKDFGNDPFKAVAGHYFPKYAHDPKLWDQPLRNSKGQVIPNSMPVKDYLNKVLPPDRVANYMKAVTQ